MNFFKKIMKKTKENKNDIKNKENIQKIEQELPEKIETSNTSIVYQENNNNMENALLKISHKNWDMIGPNSWVSTEWIIYNDLAFEKREEYTTAMGMRGEKKYKDFNGKIIKEEYEKILNNIEAYKNDEVEVKACDGSAWEFTQYENGIEIWKRKLGYIYGITLLEEITKIVNDL